MEQRDNSIDFMKGLLVILMILGHIIQFFPCDQISNYTSLYVNLTTFSGFMFTFGFVCYKAYISKPVSKRLVKRLLIGMVKSLAAFYVAGLAFNIIIEKQMSAESIIGVLTLRMIPSLSECLFCFVFAYPVIYLWTLLNNKINAKWYIAIAVLSLLATRINYDLIKVPALGALIGTKSFACFPIVQYMSFFIGGMYLASRNKIFDWWIMLISVAGLGLYGAYVLFVHDIPQRFPPSMPWVMGGYLFIYLYFLLSKKISGYFRIIPEIGKHTLIFVVISNVVIFVLYRILGEGFTDLSVMSKRFSHLIILIVCVLVTFGWLGIIKGVKWLKKK